MSNPEEQQNAKAPGHFDNQGPQQRASRPPGPDREEQHQLTRELAATDQERQSEGMPPGGSDSAAGPAEGNRTSGDREESIREKAYRLWEDGGRQEGRAEEDWHRAAQDLDREDADLERAGAAGNKAGRDRS
jgi:hypothetical protein